MKRTFIETNDFQKRVESLEEPELLNEIQKALIKYPEIGDLIRGTGGIRKFRIGIKGRGKSGGARIFYLDIPAKQQCFLIFILDKAESENINNEERNELKKLVQILKR